MGKPFYLILPTSLHFKGKKMEKGNYYSPYDVFVGVFIPNVVLEDGGLTMGARLLFGVLCQYAGKNGECFPLQKTIAEKLSISKRQAMRYVQELKEGGYIEVSRQGLGKSNIYRFLWKKSWTGESLPEVTHMSPMDRTDMSLHLKGLKKKKKKRNPIVPSGRDVTIKAPLKKEEKPKKRRENGSAKAVYTRAAGMNPRALGMNPRALGTNPRAKRKKRGYTPGEVELLEKIKDEWENEVKPKIVREQIGKKEKELNFKELCGLDNTRMRFMREKFRERRVKE